MSHCRRVLIAAISTILAGCNGSISNSRDGSVQVADGGLSPDAGPAVDDAGVVVIDALQHHGNPTRDGFYTDPYLTKAAIANLKVDPTFKGTTGSGQVFSQPLFMLNGSGGVPSLFVTTENNDVYALNAGTGAQLWTKNFGAPVPLSAMSCGNIDPRGITGTPVIDPGSRTLFVAALVYAAGNTPKEMVYALAVDGGALLWTLDVAATIGNFDNLIHGQRGALLFQNGVVYVPYGGLDGDCGNYHGWVVAIPATSPSGAKGWATSAPAGSGIWGPSGVASDGQSLFVSTGNALGGPNVWSGAQSEGVLRLTPGVPPAFSGASTDYFAPAGSSGNDWYSLDDAQDLDLGSSGVVLFSMPTASPKDLAFAIGKTQNAYLLDRAKLGGVGNGIQASPSVLYASNNQVFGSLFAYATLQGTYVGLQETIAQCANGDVSVFQVTAASPPQLKLAWCANGGGNGGPVASTSGSLKDVVVWTYGAGGDDTLRAYDGDTGGTPLVSVGALAGSNHWISPIIAGGRIYVAGNGTVTAFTVH